MRQTRHIEKDEAPETVVKASLNALNKHAGKGLIYAAHWKEYRDGWYVILYARQKLNGFKYPKTCDGFKIDMSFDKQSGRGKMKIEEAALLLEKTFTGDRNVTGVGHNGRELVIFSKKKDKYPSKFCRWPVKSVAGVQVNKMSGRVVK